MFIKPSLPKCSGFTVAEMVVAVAIASFLALVITSLAISSGRIMAGIYNYADLAHMGRLAVDNMNREIRQARALKDFQTNKLVLVDFDGVDLIYEYVPSDKTLVRIKGDTKQILLTECEWLNFSIYKQNPIPGSFALTSSTNVAACKVVSMSWNCSRSLLGKKINTEFIQDAKIIIRKG